MEIYKRVEDEEGDLSSHWTTLRKKGDTEI
jgi:hypothetical protein